MTERVLVTGGAGFIGSHLVDALLARGDDVRVLDDLAAERRGSSPSLPGHVDLRVADVRDRRALDAALEQVTAVVHLAGVVGSGHSMVDARRHTDVNAVGTATLLEAMVARRAQFRALVVASTALVYGDGAYSCDEHGRVEGARRPAARLEARKWEPICRHCEREVHPMPTAEDHAPRPVSPYAITKLAEEQLALALGRAYRLPTLVLRYATVYGSRQVIDGSHAGIAPAMTAQLLNDRRPTLFEDGLQLRDFTHVSDAVRATIAATDAPETAWYEAFNVGTGRSTTLAQAARTLARSLGRSLEPEVTGEYRDGDVRHGFTDVSRARARLGWEAKVSLDEGVAELAAWASGQRPEDGTVLATAELRARRLLH